MSCVFLQGQTTQTPAPAPAPPPAVPSVWSVGPIDFSGLIDGYYSKNFNNPEDRSNQLRNFDLKNNQFSLNMAKLTLSHSPDPVGFVVDLGFGKAWDVFHATEPGGKDIQRFIPQAYLSIKPTNGKGFQFDFGKFYTSVGAELTETHLNFNYSRALMYANGPYYHFGARVLKPVNSHWTVGAQLVNGWNNVEDNNSGKTVGLTSALTSSKVSLYNNYYVGPENNNTNKGVRNFFDTVVSLTPNSRVSAYLNIDVAKNNDPVNGDAKFWAIGFASRFALNDKWALAPRVEYYKDEDGYITGAKQALKEFTLTGEYKMAEGFLMRMEYRRDWSDVAYFNRGPELAKEKSQSTLLIGFVAFFGPKR